MPHPLTRERLLADETGTIRKPLAGRLRIALCYPHSYAVGMSNLGFQTLYRLFNAHDEVVCERAFLPETPGDPVRTVESGSLLAEMDVVAFSISYELDYPNVVRMLQQGGVPLFAADRQGPLVIAGGATMSYNPEPLAPFFDAAIIGEAEDLISPLVAALGQGSEALAALPGVYVPALGARPTARLVVADLNRVPVYNQIFTEHTEFGHMALVEVGRGCPYGCLFCVASHVYRPARWRSLAALLPPIERGLAHRRRVGLIGASVTDHPEILPLCEEILRRGGLPSPASMRADALTDELLALLARGEVRTITLAPEAGTEDLRRRVGKKLSDEALMAAAVRAHAAGIPRLKLYAIVGLPGETDEDVAAIPALVLRVARESGMHVTLGCSAFVPKPGTPFARQPMAPEREVKRKLEIIRKGLRGRAEFTHESARWAYWQAVLARGGREVGPALATIAAGEDSPSAWQRAFRAHGLQADDYALRAFPPEEPLPWAHIGNQRCVLTDVEGFGPATP